MGAEEPDQGFGPDEAGEGAMTRSLEDQGSFWRPAFGGLEIAVAATPLFLRQNVLPLTAFLVIQLFDYRFYGDGEPGGWLEGVYGTLDHPLGQAGVAVLELVIALRLVVGAFSAALQTLQQRSDFGLFEDFTPLAGLLPRFVDAQLLGSLFGAGLFLAALGGVLTAGLFLVLVALSALGLGVAGSDALGALMALLVDPVDGLRAYGPLIGSAISGLAFMGAGFFVAFTARLTLVAPATVAEQRLRVGLPLNLSRGRAVRILFALLVGVGLAAFLLAAIGLIGLWGVAEFIALQRLEDFLALLHEGTLFLDPAFFPAVATHHLIDLTCTALFVLAYAGVTATLYAELQQRAGLGSF